MPTLYSSLKDVQLVYIGGCEWFCVTSSIFVYACSLDRDQALSGSDLIAIEWPCDTSTSLCTCSILRGLQRTLCEQRNCFWCLHTVRNGSHSGMVIYIWWYHLQCAPVYMVPLVWLKMFCRWAYWLSAALSSREVNWEERKSILQARLFFFSCFKQFLAGFLATSYQQLLTDNLDSTGTA